MKKCRQQSLWLAAYVGRTRVVKALLWAGVRPLEAIPLPDGYAGTPLGAAITAGHADVVVALVRAGAPLDNVVQVVNDAKLGTVCFPALGQAVTLEKLDVIEVLLAAGASLEAADRDAADGISDQTPLEMAKFYGNVQVIEALVAAKHARRAAALDAIHDALWR